MRKSILITLLIGLTVAGLLMGISCPSQAALVTISAGVSQATPIWQTSPPAFVTARWGGISLAIWIPPVTLHTAITVADFLTMQLAYPPSFYLGASIRIAQLAITSLKVGGGAVITPAYNWIAWSLGVGLTASLPLNIDVASSIGVQTTRGARRHPPGTCINVGMYWSWRLF